MRISSVLNLTRLHTAGWESFAFVLGPLLVGTSLLDGTVLVLALIGVLINAFIFALNDLADLPRDRLDPTRQNSPLVNGEIPTAFALLLASALPISMWMLIALDDWTTAAEVGFGVLLLLGGWLCIYQKTARAHPLLLDVLFGVAMAGPIPVGVAAVHRVVTADVWTITMYFLVLCVGLNAVGGNLKDLRADLNSGFSTTAIAFGVRPDGNALILTPAYRCFLYALGATLTALGVLGLALSAGSRAPALTAAAALVVGVLLSAMMLSLHWLATSRHAPAGRGREPFVAFAGGALLVLASLRAPLASLLVATGTAFAWELLFRLYWYRRASARSTTDQGGLRRRADA